jgi:hypothetical protein
MDDEDHVLRDTDGVEPGVQIALVVEEAIIAIGSSRGVAHAHVVRGEAAAVRQHVRDDVPPEIGRRRNPVEKHDRIAFADVDIRHAGSSQLDVLPVGQIFGGDLRSSHGDLASMRHQSKEPRGVAVPAAQWPQAGGTALHHLNIYAGVSLRQPAKAVCWCL